MDFEPLLMNHMKRFVIGVEGTISTVIHKFTFSSAIVYINTPINYYKVYN